MRHERGIVLLIALILTVLLSLIGLSLTLATMTTVRLGAEFESHERAVMIADAGLSAVRTNLRARDINLILGHAATQVPAFAAYTPPSGAGYEARNPITLMEARNTNFKDPLVLPGVYRSLTGLFTPAEGTELAGGPGRYFARMVDNADEAKMGLPDNPRVDLDGWVLMRVVGVHPTLAEVETYGTATKNSVAVVEASLKADTSLAMEYPVLLNGPMVTDFSPTPKKVTIDGYDHTGMDRDDIVNKKGHQEPSDPSKRHAGIGLINNDPGGGDADEALHYMLDAVKPNKGEYITGSGGSPSIYDETQALRDSDNPDAANIFSPYFMNWLLTVIQSSADTVTGSDPNAKALNLGSPNDPQVVFVDGNLKINGNVSGCGLLVVTGSLDLTGTMDYDGLILVVGKDRNGITAGAVDIRGNATIVGGLFMAKLVVSSLPDGSVSLAFGENSFDIGGTAQIYNHSGNIRMAVETLPLRVVGWREITPEIERP